jgi:glyoxylate reductase
MPPRVVVTRPIPDQGLELLRPHCDLVVSPGPLPPTEDELCQLVPGAAGLLCLLTDPVTKRVIDAAGPGLRVISNYAVGCNNIDLVAASQRGIPVGFTPDVLTETTADLAFALLMSAARRLSEGAEYVKNGLWKTWEPQLLLGVDIHGACLGIVGMGRIGQAMARRAAGFAMDVCYFDDRGEIDDAPSGARACASLDDLIRESDFISLHVPLTTDTVGLISARELAMMKKTGVLINTGRGGLIDPHDLLEALRLKQIYGVGLDVTDPEPLPKGHPLLGEPRCLVVPHVGSATLATRAKMATMAARNLLAGLDGLPLPHQYGL